MVSKFHVRQSDVVTTITSTTFIGLIVALMAFFKNRNPSYFIFTLMIFAICLLSISAFKSYLDISIASYKEVKEALNIKLFAYFGGIVLVGVSVIYSLFV